MKPLLLFLSMIFVFGYYSLQSQSLRKVVIEEATNASCGPCASQNPTFQKWLSNHSEIVIPVIYHAWWPGSTDPMYVFNKDMNETRINYYGITGVPSGRVNGKIATPTGNWYAGAVGDTISLNNELVKQPFYSPITIGLTLQHNNGNGSVHIDISSLAKFSNKKLRVAVCEKHHYYENAGSNGEKEFYYVARLMLPNATGTNISLDVGESKSFDFDFTVDPTCADDLYAVAFIQDDNTKEILQAEWTIEQTKPKEPNYAFILLRLDLSDVGGSGDVVYLDVQALNNSNSDAVFSLSPESVTSLPQDWNVEIEGNKSQVTIPANGKESIRLKVTIGPTVAIADILLSAQVQGETETLQTPSVTIVHQSVERLHILGGEPTHSILPIISNTGWGGKFYGLSSTNYESIYNKLNSLKTIIWNGSTTGEVTSSVGYLLQNAIYNNINVIICGGRITQGLISSGVLPLLGVQFIAYCREGYGQAPWPVTLAGVQNDPISWDFGNNVRGNLIQYLLPLYRIINPTTTTPIMTFAKSKDSIFAVKVQYENSRAVLLGLNPYIILDGTIRTKLISRSIDWVEGVSAADDDILQPADFADISVTPNPASNNVSIALNCKKNITKARIYLTNVIGETIGIVYEGELLAGETTLTYSLSTFATQVFYLVAELDESVKVRVIQKVK